MYICIYEYIYIYIYIYISIYISDPLTSGVGTRSWFKCSSGVAAPAAATSGSGEERANPVVYLSSYVCMYVCMYVSIYIYLAICMYICIYVYIYIYIYIYISIYISDPLTSGVGTRSWFKCTSGVAAPAAATSGSGEERANPAVYLFIYLSIYM